MRMATVVALGLCIAALTALNASSQQMLRNAWDREAKWSELVEAQRRELVALRETVKILEPLAFPGRSPR